MYMSDGGLPGCRSIGISVKQKKMLPAESATSCQQFCSISNSNSSSAGIFAILVAAANATAEIKSVSSVLLFRLGKNLTRAASETTEDHD